jgi:hypothetical protein
MIASPLRELQYAHHKDDLRVRQRYIFAAIHIQPRPSIRIHTAMDIQQQHQRALIILPRPQWLRYMDNICKFESILCGSHAHRMNVNLLLPIFWIRTRDFPSSSIPPRIPSPSMQYPTQHVVHVVHHSKHHTKHKHKHPHVHSHSEGQVPTMPLASPMTPSFTYPSGYTSSSNPAATTPQRVHFARSRPAVIPSGPSRKASVDALALELQKKAVLTKAHHRRRTNSQPQLPVGYVQPNDPGHSGHKHGYVEDPRNPNFRYSTCSGRRKALCVSAVQFIAGLDREIAF